MNKGEDGWCRFHTEHKFKIIEEQQTFGIKPRMGVSRVATTESVVIDMSVNKCSSRIGVFCIFIFQYWELQRAELINCFKKIKNYLFISCLNSQEKLSWMVVMIGKQYNAGNHRYSSYHVTMWWFISGIIIDKFSSRDNVFYFLCSELLSEESKPAVWSQHESVRRNELQCCLGPACYLLHALCNTRLHQHY